MSDHKPTEAENAPDEVIVERVEWLDPEALSFRWDGGPGPVHVTVGSDRSWLRVHAHQAFPLTDPGRWIALSVEGPAKAFGMIEDLAELSEEDRAAVTECLRRDRLLPEVVRILQVEEKRHLARWAIETDRGFVEFEMDKIYEKVRRQPRGDVVLTDVSGNRFHVDPDRLDAASRAILDRYA